MWLVRYDFTLVQQCITLHIALGNNIATRFNHSIFERYTVLPINKKLRTVHTCVRHVHVILSWPVSQLHILLCSYSTHKVSTQAAKNGKDQGLFVNGGRVDTKPRTATTSREEE